MDAGQLDRVVVIQRRSTERDADYGSDAGRWEDYATVRAKVAESLTAGANPTAEAMVDGYARPHRITIRWRSDFDKSRMRLRYDGGRILRVTATTEMGRRQWLLLACEEWAHEQQ